ncbi:SRPBCC family protein [Catellatospora methionotrophica]|uniref:SRPBCC family protein n=1 Tax=Catellatospora methionotrophica TaxID=121620 RepID=UPI0033EBFD88
MGRDFEITEELPVDASPEQIWDAIATGPGIDSWFMGRNEVVPGPGGTVSTAFGGYAPTLPITAWEPGHRLAYGDEPAPDGRFVAYEFLIEGRAGGSAVVRTVTSGFLPGDDWAEEFEAMGLGLALFHRTLAEYLTWFLGRTAVPVTVFGPPVADWPQAWRLLHGALGLPGTPRPGDEASFTVGGVARGGTVYHVSAHALAVRTPDALYRFVRGFTGAMVAMHHQFTTTDESTAWQSWWDTLDWAGKPTRSTP